MALDLQAKDIPATITLRLSSIQYTPGTGSTELASTSGVVEASDNPPLATNYHYGKIYRMQYPDYTADLVETGNVTDGEDGIPLLAPSPTMTYFVSRDDGRLTALSNFTASFTFRKALLSDGQATAGNTYRYDVGYCRGVFSVSPEEVTINEEVTHPVAVRIIDFTAAKADAPGITLPTILYSDQDTTRASIDAGVTGMTNGGRELTHFCRKYDAIRYLNPAGATPSVNFDQLRPIALAYLAA